MQLLYIFLLACVVAARAVGKESCPNLDEYTRKVEEATSAYHRNVRASVSKIIEETTLLNNLEKQFHQTLNEIKQGVDPIDDVSVPEERLEPSKLDLPWNENVCGTELLKPEQLLTLGGVTAKVLGEYKLEYYRRRATSSGWAEWERLDRTSLTSQSPNGAGKLAVRRIYKRATWAAQHVAPTLQSEVYYVDDKLKEYQGYDPEGLSSGTKCLTEKETADGEPYYYCGGYLVGIPYYGVESLEFGTKSKYGEYSTHEVRPNIRLGKRCAVMHWQDYFSDTNSNGVQYRYNYAVVAKINYV